jgi:hypothetical protein
MAEPKREILDLSASFFGEDTGKNLDIVEFQRFGASMPTRADAQSRNSSTPT